ncbi:MAG: 4Fe-4S dicluster domain-containing protein, partial [Desulfobulbaceae bacterium]|nr:4Fe-4S dicluster domain-containing protein [Desulfobulbaceae bacterium]
MEEFSREIYWNVGHGFMTLAPMYLLFIVAMVVAIRGFYERIRVYRLGQSVNRVDHWPARLMDTLRVVLLQVKVARVRRPGMWHAIFFWSFLLLFIGTMLIVLQADFTNLLFGYKFLKGWVYKLFSLILDLAGLAAIVMLAMLVIRRYLNPPEGLDTKKDDAIMHILLMAILVTGFIIEGARMAATEMDTVNRFWSPVGYLFALLLTSLGTNGQLALHKVMWWLHLLMAMGFFMLIPHTKFRHIINTSLNSFFADRGPKGKLVNIDLEQEDIEKFGVTEVADFTWKDIFDGDACTLCNRCQERCPAYNTGKPLSPKKLVNQITEAAFNTPDAALVELIGKEALWSCTTCRACQGICPASIEHVKKIVDLRRSLVLMEGEFPGDEVMTAMEQTEVNGNPLGMGYASRGDWAKDLDVAVLESNTDVDVLYFVGCYASFDKRNIAVAKSFIALCKAAGVKVGILGKEEKCCGEPMRKMGNEYLYQSLANENIEKMKGYGVKKIVTACPHCFNTLNKDYRDMGFDIPVEHSTVFLAGLLASGKLPIKTEALNCTYHDSCYLGRHNDIYDAPRALLRAAGATLKEMENNQDEGFCCSAGGGRIMAEEKLGERINIRRVKMAAETGA